jgi:DNA-binding HxlR family transcriptional regulator
MNVSTKQKPSPAKTSRKKGEMPANVLAAQCPSRSVLQHIMSRWGVLIIKVLANQTCRFAELRRTIDGVSERMLAQTLQTLEADGLVKRVAYEVVPPHVEYSLTPLGQSAAHHVSALTEWIESSLPQVLEAREKYQSAGKKPWQKTN